jgi:hypothetical protein
VVISDGPTTLDLKEGGVSVVKGFAALTKSAGEYNRVSGLLERYRQKVEEA